MMVDRSVTFSLITGVVLVALNAFLAIQLIQAKEETQFLSSTVAALREAAPDPFLELKGRIVAQTIPSQTFPLLSGDGGETLSTVGEGATWRILILFSPFDCPSCFDEIPFWHALDALRPDRIRVVGVTTRDGRPGLREFARNYGIEIPILHDGSGELFNWLGIEPGILTPIKLLVNPNGVIVNASRSTFGNTDVQETYMDYILSVIGESPGGEPRTQLSSDRR